MTATTKTMTVSDLFDAARAVNNASYTSGWELVSVQCCTCGRFLNAEAPAEKMTVIVAGDENRLKCVRC